MVPSVATEEIPSDTTGIYPEILRLVAQCLNYDATTGPPNSIYYPEKFFLEILKKSLNFRSIRL